MSKQFHFKQISLEYIHVFNIKTQFYFKQFSLVWVHSFNVQIVLFQAIQLTSIWLIERTLSSATTPGQSGPGSDGKRVLCIPQSSSITGTSLSDCLVSYQDTRWVSYPYTEKQLVYSTAPTDETRSLISHKTEKPIHLDHAFLEGRVPSRPGEL